MSEYKVRYFGNSSVRPLEFICDNMTLRSVKDTVERSLAHYYPVYDHACVWDIDGRLAATFDVTITVKET